MDSDLDWLHDLEAIFNSFKNPFEGLVFLLVTGIILLPLYLIDLAVKRYRQKKDKEWYDSLSPEQHAELEELSQQLMKEAGFT